MTTTTTTINDAVTVCTAAGRADGEGGSRSFQLGQHLLALGFKWGVTDAGKAGPIGKESETLNAECGKAYRTAWAVARGLQGAALAVCEAGGVKGVTIPEGQKPQVDAAILKCRVAWFNFRDAALESAGLAVAKVKSKGATQKGATTKPDAGKGVAGIPGTVGGVLELLTKKGVDGVLVSVAEWLLTTQAGKATLATLAKDSPDFLAWSDGKDQNGFAKPTKPTKPAKPAKPAK